MERFFLIHFITDMYRFVFSFSFPWLLLHWTTTNCQRGEIQGRLKLNKLQIIIGITSQTRCQGTTVTAYPSFHFIVSDSKWFFFSMAYHPLPELVAISFTESTVLTSFFSKSTERLLFLLLPLWELLLLKLKL